MILNSSNSSSSPIVDGCVVSYKTSGDNFSTDHSKIIAQTNDNISASYTIETTVSDNITSDLIEASSPTLSLSSSPFVYALSPNSKFINNNNNHLMLKNLTNEMVLQHHLHHHIPSIDSDHYHHQNSPVSVSSDTALMRSSLIFYSPYTTVPSSSSSPPTTPQNHYGKY